MLRCVFVLLLLQSASALKPCLRLARPPSPRASLRERSALAAASSVAALAALAPPAAAAAADVPAATLLADASGVPAALAAYGHFLALILTSACLTAERVLIKANMSEDEEQKLVIADSCYGVSGLLVLVTGYLRVVDYGKGWEFYQHEPIFWLKMTLLAVMGASSFFPTTMIIRRALDKRALPAGAPPPSPMSPKLVSRLTSIINAEILALASIPLAASLMARGVGYAEWLPWQAGAAPVALALAGLGTKYVQEALNWTEK
jgi:uncharacterized membrane protein